MPLRCPSMRALSITLASQSFEIAPCDIRAYDYEPDGSYQCELSDEPHDFHAAFLRPIPDSEDVVFYCWDDEPAVSYLSLIPHCYKERSGDFCLLPRGHEAACEWDIIDPVVVALQANGDQTRAWHRDLERLNEWLSELPDPGI